jgi:hypothetical protein
MRGVDRMSRCPGGRTVVKDAGWRQDMTKRERQLAPVEAVSYNPQMPLLRGLAGGLLCSFLGGGLLRLGLCCLAFAAAHRRGLGGVACGRGSLGLDPNGRESFQETAFAPRGIARVNGALAGSPIECPNRGRHAVRRCLVRRHGRHGLLDRAASRAPEVPIAQAPFLILAIALDLRLNVCQCPSSNRILVRVQIWSPIPVSCPTNGRSPEDRQARHVPRNWRALLYMRGMLLSSMPKRACRA